MDMSRWDADEPGTTSVWWASRGSTVPDSASVQFQRFLTALSAYNHHPNTDTVHGLSIAVSELIEGLPNQATPAPTRERLAQVLRHGKVHDLLHSSTYAPATSSQNLMLALMNLLARVGGQVVPMRYRNI